MAKYHETSEEEIVYSCIVFWDNDLVPKEND